MPSIGTCGHAVAVKHDVSVAHGVQLAELRNGQNVAVQHIPARLIPVGRVDVFEFRRRHLDRFEPVAVLCNDLTAADVAGQRQKRRKQILRKQHRIAASAVCGRRDDARGVLPERVQKRVNRFFAHAIPHRVQDPVRIAFQSALRADHDARSNAALGVRVLRRTVPHALRSHAAFLRPRFQNDGAGNEPVSHPVVELQRVQEHRLSVDRVCELVAAEALAAAGSR